MDGIAFLNIYYGIIITEQRLRKGNNVFFSSFRMRAQMSNMCDVTQWLSCIMDNLGF